MTITLTREEAQQVLDSLEEVNSTGYRSCWKGAFDAEIELLRVRFAQHEPPCKTGSQCIGGKCPQCVVNEQEFTQHVENDDGWCDWTYPRHKDYRMKCCNCGLVHEVQFQVLGEISPQPDGSNDGVLLDDLECQVGMRMRRVKSQPEPEPVAWMNHEGTGALCVAGGMDIPDWKHLFPTTLYVAPPKPVSIAYKSEPVAWARNLTDPQPHCVTNLKYCSVAQMDRGDHLKYIPLYTAPPQRQWVGLTDEEVRNEAKNHVFDESFFNGAIWARGQIMGKNNE